MRRSDGTTVINKIVLDTMIDTSKTNIIKDEIANSFETSKKKYNITETISLRDFVLANFSEGQTSSTN